MFYSNMKITAQKVTFIMHSNVNGRMLYSNDSRIIMTLWMLTVAAVETVSIWQSYGHKYS